MCVCVYRFKPVDVGRLIAPLEQHFQKLFSKTFDTQRNELFVRSIKVSYDRFVPYRDGDFSPSPSFLSLFITLLCLFRVLSLVKSGRS